MFRPFYSPPFRKTHFRTDTTIIFLNYIVQYHKRFFKGSVKLSSYMWAKCFYAKRMAYAIVSAWMTERC